MKNLKQLFTALFLCLAFTTTASADNYDEATMGKKVVELNTVPWGQSSPYNNLCWTSDAQTTHAKTGCGPTAFAILCKYYNWPESGSGEVEPKDYSGVFAPITLGHSYDYANMREDNYPTGYSDDEANAVATLMRDLGYSLNVTYGSGGTGFSENDDVKYLTVNTIENNFNYKSLCYSSIYSGFYKISKDDKRNYSGDYEQYLKDCLDLGYPVPYSAASDDLTTDNVETSRHIFILDGYTEEGYYHFNFGWNGNGNGWFKLDSIQPDASSDYTNQQAAFVYFIPNKTTYSVTATVNNADAGTVAITSIEAGSTATASFIEGSTPKLTATPKDGYVFSHWSKGGVQVSQENTIKLDPLTSAVEYVANFLTPSPTEKVNVTVNVPNSSYGTVTYESSNVASGTVLTPFLNSAITLVAAANDNDYVFSSWTVTVGTESTNYYNETLTIAATSDMTITANFSLAQQTHTIAVGSVEKDGVSGTKCSIWRYNGIEIHSTVSETDAYALSTSSMRFYACATTSANKEVLQKPVVFTLTAPENYTIIDYSFDCYAGHSSYTVDVTKEGDAQATNVNYSTKTTISPDADINKKSTYFTLNTDSIAQRFLDVSNFTVTIKKDGAGSSEPVTPVTYNISVSASPGTSGIAYIGNGTTYSKTVNAGESVTLTAVALSGYTFTGWYLNDVLKSNSLNYTFTPTASGAYVAKFAQQQVATYTITATANNAGYGTVTGGGAYTSGASVTLTATPNSGYRFVKWTIGTSDAGTENPKTFTANANADYIAVFEAETPAEPAVDLSGKWFRLKTLRSNEWMNVLDTDDHNGTFGGVNVEAKDESDANQVFYFTKSGNGYILKSLNGNYIYNDFSSPGYWNVNANSTSEANSMLLTFEPTGDELQYLISCAKGYFMSGTAQGTGHNGGNYVYCDVASTAADTWRLEEVKFTVTASSNNNVAGTATVNGKASVEVSPTEQVTLTATEPATGYRFTGWYLGEDQVSGDLTYTPNISASAEYQARYEKITYTISVTTNPGTGEGGSASIGTETSATVEHGESVTLTANPSEGYEFVNWTKNAVQVSTSAIYTVENVTEAAEYVANFQKRTYTITATAGEGGTVSGGGEVEHGESVTLTANANSGYEFVNWTKSGEQVSTSATYIVENVTEAAEYVANFQSVQQVVNYTVTVTSNIQATVGEGVFMNSGASQEMTELQVANGTQVRLIATPDNKDVSTYGYVFDSWRVNGEVVSYDNPYVINEFTKDVEYEAYFVEGRRISFSCNYVYGNINMYDSKENQLFAGTEGVLAKLNDNVKLQAVPNTGYRFVDWVDAKNDNAFVSSENPYTFEVTEHKTLFANFEPLYYVLSVSVNDAGQGSVTVECGGDESSESVQVGFAMEATITATPNQGYRFLYWKKGDEIVSYDAEYNIPAIDDVNALVDVEYVAYFEDAPIESGTYYRIAHEFTDANAVAAVAAGETQQYEISPTTGTCEDGELENGTFFSTWIYKTGGNYPASLTLTATNANGDPVDNINLTNGGIISLRGYCDKNNPTTTYTIAVPDSGDYKITGYEIHFEVWSGVSVTYENGSRTTGSLSSGTVTSISESKLDVYSVSFEVTKTGTSISAGMDLTSFIVNIKNDESDPVIIKYYVQSEPSNVTGKANSLLMNENTGKESIFYYSETGNKLISYSTGKYIKEDGNARGLQDYGVENAGTVTIDEAGDYYTIAAPSYMHADSEALGTGGNVYFVNHCSTNDCGSEHNFILEEVETLPVTISSVGYATFYAPVAVRLVGDVEAHTIEIAGDYAMLSEGFTEVPANTGVILTGTPGDYDFTIINTAEARESILKGTVAAEYVYEEAYVLLNHNEYGLGLYKAAMNKKDNNAFLNYGHKAYLPKSVLTPAAAMSTGFRFRFATTTAIEEVEGADVDAIYDLQGRKLEGTLGAGFYIINGKKVFVK